MKNLKQLKILTLFHMYFVKVVKMKSGATKRSHSFVHYPNARSRQRGLGCSRNWELGFPGGGSDPDVQASQDGHRGSWSTSGVQPYPLVTWTQAQWSGMWAFQMKPLSKIYLFERRMTDGETEILHLLVLFQIGCARCLHPIGVSHLGVGDPRAWAVFTTFPGDAGLEMEHEGLRRCPRYSHKWNLNWILNVWWTSFSWVLACYAGFSRSCWILLCLILMY